jgi:hypothetical protein
MKKLLASTEYQYTSNGKEYHKTVVTRSDGSQIKGSRSLNRWTGRTLDRKVKDLQADIDRGAYQA